MGDVRGIRLQWALVAVLSTMLLLGLGASARRADVAALVVTVVVAGFAALLLVWRRRAFARLLKQPSLDLILKHYQKTMARMPQSEIMLAYTSAVAAVYYGEFARAEQLIGSVKWEGRGPFYEAWPLSLEALVLFWRDKAYQRGLSLARRAQELADIGGVLPGARTSRLAHATLVAVGEVLAGEGGPQTMEALQAGRKRLPLMGRLLATWGLAASFAEAGAQAKAAEALAELRAAAPHCSPLLSVPF